MGINLNHLMWVFLCFFFLMMHEKMLFISVFFFLCKSVSELVIWFYFWAMGQMLGNDNTFNQRQTWLAWGTLFQGLRVVCTNAFQWAQCCSLEVSLQFCTWCPNFISGEHLYVKGQFGPIFYFDELQNPSQTLYTHWDGFLQRIGYFWFCNWHILSPCTM